MEPCVAPEERIEVPSTIRTPGRWSGRGQSQMLRQCARELTHFWRMRAKQEPCPIIRTASRLMRRSLSPPPSLLASPAARSTTSVASLSPPHRVPTNAPRRYARQCAPFICTNVHTRAWHTDVVRGPHVDRRICDGRIPSPRQPVADRLVEEIERLNEQLHGEFMRRKRAEVRFPLGQATVRVRGGSGVCARHISFGGGAFPPSPTARSPRFCMRWWAGG